MEENKPNTYFVYLTLFIYFKIIDDFQNIIGKPFNRNLFMDCTVCKELIINELQKNMLEK